MVVDVEPRPIIDPSACCPPPSSSPSGPEEKDPITVCVYHLLASTLTPPKPQPADSPTWLHYLHDVHCLAHIVEHEWNQPSAAARVFLHALQTVSDSSSLVKGLGQVLQRHPRALYATTSPPSTLSLGEQHPHNPVINITTPQPSQHYSPQEAIPIEIQVGSLPQERWQEIGMRVCSWLDDGHLPVCYPSFTMQALSPGWHKLSVQAYGLVTQTAVSPIISVDLCVGNDKNECQR